MNIVDVEQESTRYNERLGRGVIQEAAKSFEDPNLTRYIDLKNRTIMTSAVAPSTMNQTGAMTAVARKEEAEYEDLRGP
jgi:hypothetical protein